MLPAGNTEERAGGTSMNNIPTTQTVVAQLKFLLPDFEGIPSGLKERPFAFWRAEPELDSNGNQKVKANGNPKFKKAPLGESGFNISKNRPEQWLSYDAVIKAFDPAKFTGVGVLMQSESGLVGIDLDDVTDLLKTNPAIKTLLVRAKTAGVYCERSPSDTGLRLFVYGQLPNNSGRRKGGIELYSDTAFLTTTGHHEWKGDIKEAQWLIDQLLEIIGTGNAGIKDQAATTHPSFETNQLRQVDELALWAETQHPQLWGGHWNERRNFIIDKLYPSQSEADMALIGLIARELFTRGFADSEDIPITIFETFRRSGLYRSDKERQIKNYAIPKAIGSARETDRLPDQIKASPAAQRPEAHGDILNGKKFADIWRNKFIYVPSAGKWLRWIEE
jgi:primase-polymerase (primpol)-like protein